MGARKPADGLKPGGAGTRPTPKRRPCRPPCVSRGIFGGTNRKTTSNPLPCFKPDGEGWDFEPTRRLPAYTLSKRAPSTTRPPLLQAREKRGRNLCGAASLFKPTRVRGARATTHAKAPVLLLPRRVFSPLRPGTRYCRRWSRQCGDHAFRRRIEGHLHLRPIARAEIAGERYLRGKVRQITREVYALAI